MRRLIQRIQAAGKQSYDESFTIQEKKMPKFMAKSLLIFIASASSLAGPAGSGTDQLRYLEESRNIAKEFMQTLGGTLKKQLEAGSPESAISVCKRIAPAMAAGYSKDGRVVKRVSLKNRNPLIGLPDQWERQVLEDFDRDFHDGKPAADIEKIAIVDDPDGRWFRYMKAIPTQPMCLQCHGTSNDIPAGVKAVLAEEYPEDKATGYKVGDIRGAISIKRRM
jgi:Protein of unknown function (DUF3365)